MMVLLAGCKTPSSNGFGFGTLNTKGSTVQASSNQIEAKATMTPNADPELEEEIEQKRYEDLRQIVWKSSDHKKNITGIISGLIRTFEGHASRVNSVSFSPDSKYALTGSSDGTAKLWEVSTGRLIRTIEGAVGFGGNYILRVAFSPDGQYALAWGYGSVKLWEVSTGRHVRTFDVIHFGSGSAVFSPDGRYLLTGSRDKKTKLWDTSTGRHIRTFKSINGAKISYVAFSPDGKNVFARQHNTARLWDVSTGLEVHTIEGHDSILAYTKQWTVSIAPQTFSPDGRYELTSGGNTAQLWVSSTKRGFDLMADFSDEELSLAIAEYAGEKPANQGKYESKVAFQQRIENYNLKIGNYPRWWRNRAVEKAFYRVFGAPRVTDAQYDSESSTFTVNITSDSNLASNFQHRFTLTDPIPNRDAEAFDKKLRNADLEIRFGFNNGQFSLADATFQINTQTYAALPSGDSFKPVQLVTAAPVKVFQPNLTTTDYNVDPEIAKQELELKRLRKQQAAAVELKRIKGEIAKITPTSSKKTAFLFPSKPVIVRFRSSITRPDDIAVIIGNADYKKGKDIPNVTPAYADAAGIKNYIKQSLGISDENIIFLKDASQAELIATFGSKENPKGQLFNYVKAGKSRVFVYYSGHGAPGGENGSSYIVPTDAQASLIDLNGYSLKTLYKNLSKIPAKSVTVVLEACFSGASQSGSVITKASPIYLKAKETGVPPNITVIAAGAANQIASWEQDSSSGLFTKYFLKGMSGEADAKPYGNGDGKVGYDELGRYFKETLTYWARRYYGREQTAQIVVGGM